MFVHIAFILLSAANFTPLVSRISTLMTPELTRLLRPTVHFAFRRYQYRPVRVGVRLHSTQQLGAVWCLRSDVPRSVFGAEKSTER